MTATETTCRPAHCPLHGDSQGCPQSCEQELAEIEAVNREAGFLDPTPVTARRFTLDDEPCDIAEFCTVNAIDHEEQLRIGDLQVGEEMTFGGGAAAAYTLKRVR